MGCLKNITRAVLLTAIIAGVAAIGGKDFLIAKFNNFVNPSHEVVLERAQKVGDFSKIDKEFEIEKAAGIMDYKAVLAEHKSTGQKMVVIDSGKKVILTQADITADDAETRIKQAVQKLKYQSDSLEYFHVTEKGTMSSYGQTVPYVRFNAKIKKLPVGEVSGIISVVKDKTGKDKVLVSVNEKSKYSQLIANEFFKAVK